jgi:Carboxypeptidase regulatory-like domain
VNTLLSRVGVLSLVLHFCACFSHAQIDCFGYKTLQVSRVQGQVFDPSGVLVPGAVVLLKLDGKEVSRETTGADGRFYIKAVDGKYELRVDARGFASAFAYINVGNDLAHAFRPSKLWLILGLGMGEPCPSSTTSHKKFLNILSEYKKQNEGFIRSYATQK